MSPTFDRYSRYDLMRDVSARPVSMGQEARDAYSRSLAYPPTAQGECHCGNVGLLWAEKQINPKTGQLRTVAHHCLLCRCDEHTPEAHALWTQAQRRNRDSESSSTVYPGCGRRCTRDMEQAMLAEPFPEFDEWVKVEGGAAKRAKLREATPSLWDQFCEALDAR